MNDETATGNAIHFNIDDYTDPNYAMICESEYEATEFTRYLDSIGRAWSSGRSYLDETYYGDYDDGMIVYYFNRGLRSSIPALAPGSIVLYFKDFHWDDWTTEIDSSDTEELDDFLNQFAR